MLHTYNTLYQFLWFVPAMMAVDLYSAVERAPATTIFSDYFSHFIAHQGKIRCVLEDKNTQGHSCKDSKHCLLYCLSYLLSACVDLNKDLILLNGTLCYCNKSEEIVRTGWTYSKWRDDVCTSNSVGQGCW